MNSNAASANSAKSDAETSKFIPPKKFPRSGMIGKENHTITGCMAMPNFKKRKPAAPSRGQVIEWNNKLKHTRMSPFESDDDDDDDDDDEDLVTEEVDQDHQHPTT